MYILLMGILVLLLMASIGDFSEMLSVVGVMVVATLIKLSITLQALQQKYIKLESRFENYVKEQLAKEQAEDATQTAKVDAVEVPETPIAQETKSGQEETSTAPIVSADIPKREAPEENTSIQVEEDIKVISHKASTVHLKQNGAEKHNDLVSNLIEKTKNYFMTGNPMVKVGGVILFFGLTFLIRFAFANDMISIEAGLFSVLLFAIALTGLGWKFKAR